MSTSDAALMENFLVRLAGRESTEVIPVIGGSAVLNDRFPNSHVHNQLLLCDPVPVDTAIAEAERVLGARGLGHRRIVWIGPPPAHGREELRQAGWNVDENLLMRWDAHHEHHHHKATAAVEVQQVPTAVVRAAVEKSWIDDGESPETARQLADRSSATEAACVLSTHAVLEGGEPVAWCELRQLTVRGVRIGQIESVYTLESRRRHGYGRAVTVDALTTADGAGCALIFLEADANDWPRHMYGDLGFHTHGTTMNATLVLS
jgi:GNAT superfamily N-acetyltransferase